MDRREFLKRSFTASVLTVLSIEFEDCEAIWRTNKGKAVSINSAAGLPLRRMAFGGNLFTAYSHGRFSVDDAEVRL